MPELLESRQLLSTFDFPKPLLAEIAKLDANKTLSAQNKSLLLHKAYEHLPAGFKSAMTSYQLDPVAAGFVLKTGGAPAYFAKPFVNHAPGIEATTSYYDYNADPKHGQGNDVWVDFANKFLGGGVFRDGFVQEEVMFLETPELANAAATKSVDTRIPNETPSKIDGPLEGSPQPWFFGNVTRVTTIDTAAIGDVTKASRDLVDKSSTVHAPQSFNVVAIAAPKLASKADQTNPAVVQDLFNSFMAGFTLARAHASTTQPWINTGAIGAGAFNNSRTVVYVLQDLAARQLGVNLKWWGYSAGEAAMLENSYVGPILTRYAADAAANPAMNTVSHLLSIATDVFNHPKLGATAAPAVTATDVTAVVRRHDRLGRPVGTPLVGISFTFNTAMDPSTLADPRNYRVSYAFRRSVGGRLVTTYKPVPLLSVAADPDGARVTITTRSTRALYARGGRVVLSSDGLRSQGGAALGGASTFAIGPRATELTS